MASATPRFPDSVRRRFFGKHTRRRLALAFLALSAVAAIWLLGRDTEWRTRQTEARAAGLIAQDNGDHAAAKVYFEAALANNPYDWESHLLLADLLNHRLNDNAGALRHYFYALAYGPGGDVGETALREVHILRLIQDGDLEDPEDAVEDMFRAVEAGAEDAFRQRLASAPRELGAHYWSAWSERGRGAVDRTHVHSGHDGFYVAVMELRFADGTVMSVQLRCSLRDIWRLELGFP